MSATMVGVKMPDPNPSEFSFLLRDHERRITRIEDEGVAKTLVRVEERLLDVVRRLEGLERTAAQLAESDAKRQGGVGTWKYLPALLGLLGMLIATIIGVATYFGG